MPGGRVGRRERDDVPAPRPYGRRGERPRRPDESRREAVQGHGHPARRPAAAERRHHRNGRRQGHRQIREAGRTHRVPGPDDQPGAHATRGRTVRDQVPRRGDLLATSTQPPDHVRDRRAHAAGARPRGRSEGPAAVHGATEHPGGAVPHGPGRSGPGDRGPGHGQGGLQFGHASLRRRSRQLDDRHRRDGRRRGRGAEHTAQQDLRLRIRAAPPTGISSSTRRSTTRSGRTRRGGWSPHDAGGSRHSCGPSTGTRRGIGPRTRSRSQPRHWAPAPDSTSPRIGRS